MFGIRVVFVAAFVMSVFGQDTLREGLEMKSHAELVTLVVAMHESSLVTQQNTQQQMGLQARRLREMTEDHARVSAMVTALQQERATYESEIARLRELVASLQAAQQAPQPAGSAPDNDGLDAVNPIVPAD